MQALAREYLVEQLTAQGIAKRVPPRYIAEIARRYASVAESRPLSRLAAVSDLMRHLDVVVPLLTAWVQDGREFPRRIAELPLPGAVPDVLQQDVRSSEDAENFTR